MKIMTGDVSDAFFLTELLRLNILPTGHLYDRKTRPVRDLLRRRLLMVRQRTSLILSFKSLNERTTATQPVARGGQPSEPARAAGVSRSPA